MRGPVAAGPEAEGECGGQLEDLQCLRGEEPQPQQGTARLSQMSMIWGPKNAKSWQAPL